MNARKHAIETSGLSNARALIRRGSILVLVVGIIALMAIIVVVYASLGQGDRRRAASLASASKLGDQSTAVADYLAGVVARGAFKTQAEQRVIDTLPPVRVRIAADYPSIDPSLVFDPVHSSSGISGFPLQRALKYTPSGSVEAPWAAGGGTGRVDPRFPFDAFLAAAQPANLRFGGDPTTIDVAIVDKTYVADRDWRMISNASPDGRFVNLVTLRNNFGALSGVGLANNGQPLSATNRPRTTYDLTLLNDADVPGLTTPEPTLDVDAAVRPWAYDTGTGTLRNTLRTDVSDANQPGQHFPADFTANQVGMFIPLADTRPGAQRIGTLNRLYTGTAPSTISPGDQEYLGNQYADADGDGMADSRWFELVDASDPSLPRSLIPADPELRLFVASRIVDLSGKVNVNTATTFANVPDLANPAGATPADIDLERLLSLRGAYQESPAVANGPETPFGPGYEAMAQPNGPADRTGDYNDYAAADGAMLPGAFAVGEAGFAAMLDTLVRGTNAPANTVPDEFGAYPRGFARAYTYGLDSMGQPIVLFTGANGTAGDADDSVLAFDRRFLYGRSAGPHGDASGATLRASEINATWVPSFDLGGRFGLMDELDLRARERVNDASRRSRLEAVLAGRVMTTEAPAPAAQFATFSPLRDTRGLDLESLARDRTTSVYIPGGPPAAAGSADGKPDPSAYLQAKIDVRQNLTTLSGARPLTSTVLSGNGAAITSAELKVDLNAALADIQRAAQQVESNQPAPNWGLMQQGINTIFSGAVEALLPFARENDNINPLSGSRIAWDTTATRAGMTLNYGGGRNIFSSPSAARNNSAEVALRAAAHWTANLIASRQTFRPDATSATGPLESADRPVMFALPIGGKFPDDPQYARQLMFGGVDSGSGGPIIDGGPWGLGEGLNDFPAAFPAEAFTGVNAGREKAPRIAGRLDADWAIPANSASWPAAGTQNQRLAPLVSGGAASPPVLSTAGLTVLGITPQPFITQAGLITMYAARQVEGGDTKCNDNDGEKLKIGGPASVANKSYLFEAMAIQLHNPFDCEIALGGHKVDADGRVVPRLAGDTFSPSAITYYIEFGGRIYGLANFDDASNSMSAPGILLPGESRTFYILDQPVAQIAQRFLAVDAAYAANSGLTADGPGVENFIEGQFYEGGPADPDAMRLPLLDFSTMDVRTSVPSLGLYGGTLRTIEETDAPLPTADSDKDEVVRLWRVQRNALSPNVGTGNPLARPQDILVDRLRDPETSSRGTWDRRFKDNSYLCIEVAGTATPDEGPAFMFWGTVRRPGDTPQVGVLPPTPQVGVLPLYCVESKGRSLADGNVSDVYRRGVAARSLNARFADEHYNPLNAAESLLDMDHIEEGDLDNNPIAIGSPGTIRAPLADRLGTLVAGIESFRVSQTTRVIPDVDERPLLFTKVQAPFTNADVPDVYGATPPTSNIAGLTLAQSRVSIPMLLPVPRDGDSTRVQRPPGPLGSAVPASPLRPMDLLEVPAFGPSNDPEALAGTAGDYANNGDKLQLNVQWTTLSEAAALAMGFDGPEMNTSPEYALAGRHDATGTTLEVEPLLVRGKLRPDAFFAFLDDPAGNTGRREFNPATSLPRGQRLPLALGLLDRFSTAPLPGSLTSSIPGTVNINTASLDVLRSLPMLSPDPAPIGWPNGVGVLRGDGSATPWFDPSVDAWDVAAMVAAYRDKAAVALRPFVSGGQPQAGLPPAYANFRDDSVTTNPTIAGNLLVGPYGRSVWTQRMGIREQQGFASVGEILSARYGLDAPQPNGGVVNAGTLPPLPGAGFTPPLEASSIDRFARLPVVTARTGDTMSPVAFTTEQINGITQVVSGFGGRVRRAASTDSNLLTGVSAPALEDRGTAIADAVMNTITVRSDLFCVWFVLHGYRRGDVEGLQPTDPMTPSVARRYVMVVDRSNVVTLGQKPRVLMLEEVPYK
ncbi:MAG: hypothetical protein ACKVS8_11810 [Phycisphaerales bacterium]